MVMASPSTCQSRNDLQPRNENKREDVGENTDRSPYTNNSFSDSPHMDQGPNDPTHPDGGVNESPQTDHDDSDDWFSEGEDYFCSYWGQEYAGHFWRDNCGWRAKKPESPPEPWWIEDPPQRSPSDQDYLCEVCRHINFRWLFENNMPKGRSSRRGRIVIGTFGRVLEQANCSFCVLLATSRLKFLPEAATVRIQRKCFSEFLSSDCNHPETEVKYFSVCTARGPAHEMGEIDLQLLHDSRPMRGRQITPYIKQQQQNIARQWLEKCEHEHCSDEGAPWVHNLALIDLNQRCIVRPIAPVRYAALSYVWGKTPQRMYSTETQQAFETKGTLHSKQSFLPQTITDAMDLAAHMGLDYLWVDSLCILQDDEANRSYFISKMGSIYGIAAITIVDANGDHAHSGLVGMSSPRESYHTIATVHGMQLCTTAILLNEPWRNFWCAWLNRGWTYQEMLLSKRLLLVTHAQLRFVCNHAVYVEETHPHCPRTSDWTMPASQSVIIRRSEALGAPMLNLYHEAVKIFTLRVLTHEVDVIPAFDAILKALYKDTGAKSLFNLPDIEIEDALFWNSGYIASLSTERTERRRQPDRIPTWSWAGWRGRICYDLGEEDAPSISAVLWRCAPTSAVNKRSEFVLQDYRCANWREKGWNCRYLSDQKSYAYTHYSRPNVLFQHPISLKPNAGLHRPSLLDDSGTLQFSAFTVHISTSAIIPGLRLDNSKGLRDGSWKIILDSSQYLAGPIFLDCLPANEVGLRLVALARCSEEGIRYSTRHLGIDIRNIAPLDWDPQWFKNISPPNDTHKPRAEYDLFQIWDRRRFQDKFYPLYIALLVEVREGIAYRIGIGQIHIDAFHAANPIWEEVRLG